MSENMISENLSHILSKIAECEAASGREKGSVRLVAVSKFHPAESVIEAMNAGQMLFGENRVQEAAAKFDSIRELGKNPELHIIGSLQSNKVKEAVRIASCIESVDRIELIEKIEKQCGKIDKKISVLLEIHTGEESKSGFKDEKEVVQALSDFSNGKYPHVVPIGFMTMAPNTDDKKLIRLSFSSVRELFQKMRKQFPVLPLTELSMGMSGDFPIAIDEGATIVRVGTAIFGARDYSSAK